MNVELVVLRVLHIVPGVLWVGSLYFMSFFLQPALQASGVANAVMPKLMARRLPLFMMSMAGLTILAGARLMWIVSVGMNPLWTHSAQGRALMWGATAALVGFVAGMALNMPAAKRLGQVMAGPDAASRAAEIAALQGRMRLGSLITSVLLGVALLCMAVARYA